MKKQIKGLLTALLLSAIFTGCGVFEAAPNIDSFTASATSIDEGESVTFTITGSTKDAAAESDVVDYTGTIVITSNSGSTIDTIEIADTEVESFTKTTAITFPSTGVFTITATLSAGSKSVEETVTITVYSAVKPWASADSGEPYTISSAGSWNSGYSINPTGDIDWFKFQTSSTYYIVHWQDSYDYLSGYSYSGDVKVTVYNDHGAVLGGAQDSGCWESTGSVASYGSTDGIRVDSGTDYTSGEYIYIKVEGFSSTSSGTYSLYIY